MKELSINFSDKIESYADTRATCPYVENKLIDDGFGGQTLETFCSKDDCENQDEIYAENDGYRKVCRV